MSRVHFGIQRVFPTGLPITGIAALTLAFAQLALGADLPWPPPSGVPITRWGKEVSADKPVLPEYPRPQLVRNEWLNLNGLWDYAIVAKETKAPAAYAGKILVPYPPQSILSQVNKRIDEKQRIWYRRTFEIPKAWAGQRVLLHFGAVNWESHVRVNGKELGSHSGNYDGFGFDVTDVLTPSGPQELIVSAWNPVEYGGIARGKQALRPGLIHYTPTTGIWQTVWLEPVPQAHIENLKMVPDVDGSRLQLTAVTLEGKPSETIEAVVMASGKEISRATGKPGQTMAIAIPAARLWWPEDPFLYDLKVTLKDGSKTVDTVTSYFGMRKISLGPDEKGRARILLNNQFVFQNGFLDQGFWPDGIYTAPTDAALRSDIETIRKLGYNMSRKHIKVEPERWYYWADKLGLLVWQDMPSSTEMGFGPHKEYIPDVDGQFELELRRMIQGRYNHPCIVMWVVFNEGWGLSIKPKKSNSERDVPSDDSKARVHRMFKAAKQEDSTRLINAESGAGGGANGTHGEELWDFGDGDIVDFHAYGGQMPTAEAKRAAVVGEYGWGFDPRNVFHRLLPDVTNSGISGIVLTQITDVENEKNAPLTYDRTLRYKVPAETVGAEVIEKFHKAGFLNYPGSGTVKGR